MPRYISHKERQQLQVTPTRKEQGSDTGMGGRWLALQARRQLDCLPRSGAGTGWHWNIDVLIDGWARHWDRDVHNLQANSALTSSFWLSGGQGSCLPLVPNHLRHE